MSMKQNKLNHLQSHKLFALVAETYVTSGKTDVEFALQASQSLGFTVLDTNVGGTRRALGIVSNFTAQAAAKKAAEPKKYSRDELADLYCALDDRVKAIEKLLTPEQRSLLADAGRPVNGSVGAH